MKLCRHCKLEIHDEARLCPHCHGYQGWIANQQKDPRMAFILVAFVGAVAGMIFLVFKPMVRPPQDQAPSVLTVKEPRFRLVATPEGPRAFVWARVANAGAQDAGQAWFRVTLLGEGGDSLDEALVQANGLVVPAGGTESLRLSFVAAPAPSEVKAVKVTFVRAKEPTRWD